MIYDGFDIIGDVHGCANTLEKLLQKLGYEKCGGVYTHPSRQAIFVGDVVDRGPHIREALHLIKNMTDHGSAQCILGNHEFNLLCYTTLVENSSTVETEFIRSHSPRNNRLVTETLTQFASFPEEWRMFLDWFLTLPLFLELDRCRIVHACWDESFISEFKKRYLSNRISKEYLIKCKDRKSFEFRCVDRLTRGTDIRLPDDRMIKSKEGIERNFFRTKFWASKLNYYKDVVFQPDPLPEDLLEKKLSDREREKLIQYRTQDIPVFIGHYWLQGRPRPLKHNVACLDYSAVKYGRLVAYRFNGEQMLNEENFMWVYVDPDQIGQD